MNPDSWNRLDQIVKFIWAGLTPEQKAAFEAKMVAGGIESLSEFISSISAPPA